MNPRYEELINLIKQWSSEHDDNELNASPHLMQPLHIGNQFEEIISKNSDGWISWCPRCDADKGAPALACFPNGKLCDICHLPLSNLPPEEWNKIPQQDGWFRVEDCLPAPNCPVLCWDNQHIKIASMPDEEPFNEHWKYCSKEDIESFGCTGAVTHWRPLPEPPKV